MMDSNERSRATEIAAGGEIDLSPQVAYLLGRSPLSKANPPGRSLPAAPGFSFRPSVTRPPRLRALVRTHIERPCAVGCFPIRSDRRDAKSESVR